MQLRIMTEFLFLSVETWNILPSFW